MSRPKRSVNKLFKVFCEGDTEHNYFDYIRKYKKVSLTIKPINMNGGGYANFLSQLQQDANSNCLAKFIVIDGDRANDDPNEKSALWQLVEYCTVQNKSNRTPHILIIDYPDFEYVACLHTFNYKGQNTANYIKTELGYTSVDDFKADKSIFKILVESRKGSIAHLEKSINNHTSIIKNTFHINKSMFDIQIQKTVVNKENLGFKGTNFEEFYYVLKILGVAL